jgi:putative IMPACT (imprinted ancient) family translation regulator
MIESPDMSVSQKCIPYLVVMLPSSNGIISGFGFLITAHKRHANNCNAPVRSVKYAPHRITDINMKFARSQHGKAALEKRNFTLMKSDYKNCVMS